MWRVKEQKLKYDKYFESIGEDQNFDMVFESRLEALTFICNKMHMSPYDECVDIYWGEDTIVEFCIEYLKGMRTFVIYKE